ncbi:MAG: hypothetical protein COW65_18065 [Cytophagales bacterium CG18_big_fil_WC_8_21_14_2_50_42_9]|nr:MAG: hypothetical protein COW65_18065 [Cytophagales bacterium CG18_big_fil_WC_8_21_14_2_50_42_9]
MKIRIILLIVSVLLFSCREDSNEFKTTITQQHKNKNDFRLIGSWMMNTIQWQVKTDSTTITKFIQYNQCPELSFSSDNKGFIKLGNGSMEQIKWKVNKQFIQIVNVSSGNKSDIVHNPTLNDGNYRIMLKDSIEYQEGILINLAGTKFILSKI